MTLLVDPPPRNHAAGRSATDAGRPAANQLDASRLDTPPPNLADSPPEIAQPAGPVKLAEPPIPGGRVEAAMGVVIRVLSHSPLARPLPAVILSALGLGGVAFVGLCATAPAASVATPPVLLPLTSVARDLGAPHLPDPVADLIMYGSIGLCCLGLAMMLWANSRGWSPNPRRVFWTAVGAIAVLVNITPVGSSDAASYGSPPSATTPTHISPRSYPAGPGPTRPTRTRSWSARTGARRPRSTGRWQPGRSSWRRRSAGPGPG
jgi:hypothetical protein